MGRGRKGGVKSGGKEVSQGGACEEGGWKGPAARDRPLQLTHVRLALPHPVPLADPDRPNTALVPAPCIHTLPPLALGGMGGDALNLAVGPV
jgi:hypothetical protein